MSASLIGHLRSSTFRLSTTAVSMSLTGSRFSSESAPRPLYGAFLVKKFAALLLLMLEAVTTDLVSTISLKRSTQNLQLSTSWAGRLHLSLIHISEPTRLGMIS